mgnify:CR=1 FL=1
MKKTAKPEKVVPKATTSPLGDWRITTHIDLVKRPPMPLGASVFIRTVTHHYTGKVVREYGEEVELIEAAWIADDGRFNAAMASGAFDQVEPWPKETHVFINRSMICDWCVTQFSHPTSTR